MVRRGGRKCIKEGRRQSENEEERDREREKLIFQEREKRYKGRMERKIGTEKEYGWMEIKRNEARYEDERKKWKMLYLNP